MLQHDSPINLSILNTDDGITNSLKSQHVLKKFIIFSKEKLC